LLAAAVVVEQVPVLTARVVVVPVEWYMNLFHLPPDRRIRSK
jgi:hypothetical protein